MLKEMIIAISLDYILVFYQEGEASTNNMISPHP